MGSGGGSLVDGLRRWFQRRSSSSSNNNNNNNNNNKTNIIIADNNNNITSSHNKISSNNNNKKKQQHNNNNNNNIKDNNNNESGDGHVPCVSEVRAQSSIICKSKREQLKQQHQEQEQGIEGLKLIKVPNWSNFKSTYINMDSNKKVLSLSLSLSFFRDLLLCFWFLCFFSFS